MVQRVQVFYLVWEQLPRGMTHESLKNSYLSMESRWDTLKYGRRNTARQVILVYFTGNHSDEFIRKQFLELMDRIIVDEES